MSLGQPARVNTLPLEILSAIFATIVDAGLYARSVGDNSYGSCEYPTLVSSVCAHWRRISIGTPHLWAYIDLMPSNKHVRNIKHVKLWLERSQNSPLRLRIGGGGDRVEEFYAEFPKHISGPLYSILASAAPRLRSLALKFNDPDFATEAFSVLLSEERHPIRELALRNIGWGPRNLLSPSEWDRLLEPLRVLHLEIPDIKLGTIPCRNLVELQLIHYINFPSITQFLRVLESNPSLRTIMVHCSAFTNVRPPPEPRSINLPSLRYLRLSTNEGCLIRLLNAFAPGPHELDLRLDNIYSYNSTNTSLVDSMVSFFKRARVRSLYLQHEDEIPLFPILASLPHLQTLGLSRFDFDRKTFAGLEGATNLLPKLHTINLNKCSSDDHSKLHPGLRALLSLPSVQRIRHLNCGHVSEEGARERFTTLLEGTRETFIELLEGGGFAAPVIHASPSDFVDPVSPFES